MSHTFYILDVFAMEKYTGNQLAVVRGAEDLDGDTMQLITREMHYSESTFIAHDNPPDGGFDVRIFTPGEEVPFAGHPTLGTAYVIAREILRRPVEKVVLNLKVGQIPVKFERQGEAETLWMKQVPPAFGRTFDLGVTARCLGLPEEDIDDRFPVQDVSTGLPFIIAPVRSLGAVRRCRPTHNDLLRLTEGTDSKAVVVFARETYNADNHLNVRVFTDLLGIPEDPATGSGNGCLAGYLSKYRFFGSGDVSCRVEQGYEIGRPSLLYLKSRPEGASIAVEVGGSVVMVAKGELV